MKAFSQFWLISVLLFAGVSGGMATASRPSYHEPLSGKPCADAFGSPAAPAAEPEGRNMDTSIRPPAMASVGDRVLVPQPLEYVDETIVGKRSGSIQGLKPGMMALLAIDLDGFEWVSFEGIFSGGKVGVTNGSKNFLADATLLGFFVKEVAGFKKNEEVIVQNRESKIRARVVAYFPLTQKVGVQFWSEASQT